MPILEDVTNFDDINDQTGLLAVGPLPSKAPVGSFNLDQVENLLQTKGFVAFHYPAALNYNRETYEAGVDLSQPGIERPFVYFDPRPVRIVPYNFNLTESLQIMGVFTTSSLIMNITGQYIDGNQERVYVSPNDLILLSPAIQDLYKQTFVYDGKSEIFLHYPVKSVTFMASKSAQRMKEGTDFKVNKNGSISFVRGGKKPKLSKTLSEVVSVVYYCNILYTVKSVPHNLRLLPDNHLGSGALPRIGRYAPQQLIVDRTIIRDGLNYFDLPEIQNYEQYLSLPQGDIEK